ncbi:A1S_1983 family putative colistin resistance protein [Acinetobacter baretiae]
MHLVFSYVKKIASILAMYCLCTQAYASRSCSAPKLCEAFKPQKEQLMALFQQTNFVSNAPRSILHITHSLWDKRIHLCKTPSCFTAQFNQRTHELNEFSTLNQTLTQHFIKYQDGKISTQQVYLQIHQLEQNKLKIDGYAYHLPQLTQQHFLAYSQNSNLTRIINNEDGCAYNIKLYKGLLSLHSDQKTCRIFAGNYRRYD